MATKGRSVSRFGVRTAGILASLFVGLAGAQAAQRPGGTVLPSDAEIRKVLAERVGAAGDGVGIVVGVVEPAGRRVISCGLLGPENPRPPDGDTAFEIGSVTKVFTAMLLADMVRRGEVSLAAPVAKYLPASAQIPQRNGRAITLLDLATHTSGLPFMPGEGATSPAHLYRFLAGYELKRDIGAERDYSNLGYWLLGEALASRAGMDYERLLRTRILLSLHLRSTALTLSPALKAKLALGHDASLQPSPPLSAIPVYSLMPAAGGLISTANDLSSYLEVLLGYQRSPLSPAVELMLTTRRPMSRPGVEQALGWTIEGASSDPLIFHDGGTWGYASAVAWDPRKRAGVVVLSNQVGDVGDIARHLLRPNVPLAKPTVTRHTEIALDSAVLDAYAGRYEAPGEGVFVIAREGEFLTIEAPSDWGLPKLRLRPESRHDFFTAELPMRVTFQTADNGRASGLLIYPPRGQKPVPARRSGESR